MMLCFMDITFCSSDCINEKCIRHFGDDDKEAAVKWMKNPPVAMSDFSKDCPDYIKPEKDKV